MTLGSIRARLLVWSGGLTGAALVVAWFAISQLFTDFVDRRMYAELNAVAGAVMAGSDWSEKGNFAVEPAPADPRFERPLSGWYWQVADGTRVLARAPSLVTGALGPEGMGVLGPDGAALIATRSRFSAPGDGRELFVTVTLPAAEARAELRAIRQPLLVALTILGVSLIAAQIVAVRRGLIDLTRFASVVGDIQKGTSAHVPEPDVAELRPLAAELRRLIDANAAQIARARAHTGDLAHALKTPLSVLANRASHDDAPLLARIEQMINWHLKRARAAAAGLDPNLHSDVGPVLDDIELVLHGTAVRKDVRLSFDLADVPAFRGDAEDLGEIIGALAENAVQWATSKVHISAKSGSDQTLVIEISDDGPGIPESERTHLMTRGARLDETSPGHGLGLAIATDRARDYGGSITLAQSKIGGLLVRVILPAWM